MALQASGPITVSDIQAEVGITPGSAVNVAGASSPVQAGSLFGEATGTINKAAPHSISEFYGYNQVDDFILDTAAEANPLDACNNTAIGSTKWYEGDSATPQVGDIIWNEGTSTSVFNGGGSWYRIPAEDKVIQINASGVVLQKVDCTGTISISLSPDPITSAGGSVTITVTSNTSWTLSEIVSWVSIASPTGSGNATRTATVGANVGAARTATITAVIDLTSTSQVLDQLAGSYVTISLRYHASSAASACSASPTNVKADTADLSTATTIRNFFTEAPATTGYYSDGVIVRHWNSATEVLASPTFC